VKTLSDKAFKALRQLKEEGGQGIMGKRMANLLRAYNYVKVVHYLVGSRASVQLTPDGQERLESFDPQEQSTDVSEWEALADKIVQARLQLKKPVPFHNERAHLAHVFGLVDVLAETCLKMLDELEKRNDPKGLQDDSQS
jgi:hypothetical protein